MTNEEKLFVTVKSDISNCICKIANAKGFAINDTFLNYSANKYTDILIKAFENTVEEFRGEK